MAQLALRFWGKTFQTPSGGAAPSVKPTLHHMMDVAAVALRYMALNPSRLRREATNLNLPPDDYARLAAFLAGLHDLGKFSRSFQVKRPDLWPQDVLGECPSNLPDLAHWRLTARLMRANAIASEWSPLFPGLTPDGLAPVIAAVAGHHGRPPEPGDLVPPRTTSSSALPHLDSACIEAARQATQELADLLQPPAASGLARKGASDWSWRLSGLITLADWIGSDADFFGPSSPDTATDDYWQSALDGANRAVAAKGLIPHQPFVRPKLAQIVPERATSPRPMQVVAETVSLGHGPELFIVEDATGSGKTEAALVLAARLIAAGRGEGIYVALPTMATANAMYGRLASLPERLFAPAPGSGPSMVLAHGKAGLMRRLEALREAHPSGNAGGETTAAYCNSWIADSRRKAFFADIGAGTIDQAFLAILPKKHLTLRQHALAGRILIVDEAHSFDAYMGEELQTLLRLQAMNGGSAIVLSATLPDATRSNIVDAFRSGLGREAEDDAQNFSEASEPRRLAAYPLLTHVEVERSEGHPVPFDDRLRRRVAIRRIGDRSTGIDMAIEAAGKGAAVLIICNAVDEAVSAYLTLIGRGHDPSRSHLFHARFAQIDRQTIEQAILARFGRDGPLEDREGHVLVATQVVEQSLDLDFDLVITDLAPIDLIIQRAGRLWRHMDLRPSEHRPVRGPEMVVVSPDPASVTSADWLEPVLGRATPVYGRAGIMWRSARTLFQAGRISTPDDYRPMIEQVYGRQRIDLPACLQAAEIAELGKAGGHRTLGLHNVIKPETGYSGLPSDLSVEEDIGTRLGEPTITIRLARRLQGRLVPWAQGGLAEAVGLDLPLAWSLSEVSVRKAFWGDAAPPGEDRALHLAARKDWPEWESTIVLVEVEQDGNVRTNALGRFGYDSVGLMRMWS